MSPHEDDLGLSLTLAPSFDTPHRPIAAPSLHLRLLPSPFLRGIDVNRALVVDGDAEEDVGVSSPNSTVSSVSGKRGQREETTSENDRACSAGAAGGSDDEDAGDGSRKKLRLSKDQSAVLEESFKEHNTLNPKQKMALAKQLNLRPRQVEVWFQNRRARTKLKQTEVDCEFLKRCCENLTEENRRLQKEVQELRALKLSPQFYMHMTPPTTLTMCPSCERVSTAAAATPPTSSAPVSAAHPALQAPSSNGNARRNPFFQQHHSTVLVPQNQPVAMGPNLANPVLPWAPMPLRVGAFVNVQTQRS